MEYFETDPIELSKRARLPYPDICFEEATDEKGWHLFHAVNIISIVDEHDCSFKKTVKMLTDMDIRHSMHKLGINDYTELNFMMRKYKIKFVLEGVSHD